jgi:hypothetical protein
MAPKEEVLTKFSEMDNYEDVQPGREYLQLLKKSKAYSGFEKAESRSHGSKINSKIMKLYLSL